MNTTKTEAIDPICGMTGDTATVLHAECDGRPSIFAASTVARSSWQRLRRPSRTTNPLTAAVVAPR